MKLIFLMLLSISLYADIKVNVIEEQEVKIPEISAGFYGQKKFKVLCINGYQWLSSGIDNNFTLSQMFESNYISFGNSKPISCVNK